MTTSRPRDTTPAVRTRKRREGEEGVIVILFAMSLVVLLGFAGLVYTGAQALVLRRQLQNAGDAAALAASNLLIVDDGCSPAGIGGPPRDSIVAAAKAAVAENLPSYDTNDVTVTCPSGYNGNIAVKVDLHDAGPSYFGMTGLDVATSSVAINGQATEHEYAVVLLNPMNASWPSQRNGCASFLVNGGVTMTFEKSIYVNSRCTVADSNNGALKALNSGFRMTMTNGAVVRIAGEMALNTVGNITPHPEERFRPLVSDPLSALVTPDAYLSDAQSGAVLPSVNMASTGSGICRGQDPCILPPGRYPGGLAAGGGSAPSTLLLRPGVYYIAGGGMKLKSASARVFAIPHESVMSDSVAKTTFATTLTADQVGVAWQAACPLSGATCGVMVYNAPSSATSWTLTGANADQIANGSQGMLMLRGYNPASDSIAGNATAFLPYENLVFWQSRTPVPTQASAQPELSMSGGACVVISGTVYGPGAEVDFGGSSCGTGGGGEDVSALQFIVWDLTISGTNNFYFAYQRDFFASPYVYGLVE